LETFRDEYRWNGSQTPGQHSGRDGLASLVAGRFETTVQRAVEEGRRHLRGEGRWERVEKLDWRVILTSSCRAGVPGHHTVKIYSHSFSKNKQIVSIPL